MTSIHNAEPDPLRLPQESSALGCIFCGQAARSKEHLLPAALGGTRAERGILCKACNQRFSRLDESLVRQLAYFATQLGVPDRSRTPRKGRSYDPRLGRHYTFQIGGQLEPQGMEVQIERRGEGAIVKVLGTARAVEEFAAKTRKIFPVGEETFGDSEFVPVEARSRVHYRSRAFRRGSARVVLNFLAHVDGALARSATLRPLKTFVKTGREQRDARLAWEDFGSDLTGVPATGAFHHRVVLQLPSENGRSFGRITWLGNLVAAVDLGELRGRVPTYVFDIDPSKRAPNDTRCSERSEVLPPPIRDSGDTLPALGHRILQTARRVQVSNWRMTAGDLLASLNETRLVRRSERPDAVVKILNEQTGRIVSILRTTIRFAGLWYSDPLKPEARARLRRLLAAERGSLYELSRRTLRVVQVLRVRLAEYVSDRLVYRSLTLGDLFNIFEGLVGADIAIGAVASLAGIGPQDRNLEEVARLSVQLDRDVAVAARRSLTKE